MIWRCSLSTIAVVIINTHKLTFYRQTQRPTSPQWRGWLRMRVFFYITCSPWYQRWSFFITLHHFLHHLLSMVPKVIFSGTILCGRGKYTMTHDMSLKQRFIMTFVFSTAGVLVAKYGQICKICIFGCAKYGQVGCPLKDLAKCSSDALVLGQ